MQAKPPEFYILDLTLGTNYTGVLKVAVKVERRRTSCLKFFIKVMIDFKSQSPLIADKRVYIFLRSYFKFFNVRSFISIVFKIYNFILHSLIRLMNLKHAQNENITLILELNVKLEKIKLFINIKFLQQQKIKY